MSGNITNCVNKGCETVNKDSDPRQTSIIIVLIALFIALLGIDSRLRDIRGILYDIRTQNEYKELMK